MLARNFCLSRLANYSHNCWRSRIEITAFETTTGEIGILWLTLWISSIDLYFQILSGMID